MSRFHTTLQPILDILDEGLRLYRRGFVGFLLLTALFMVPLAVGLGLAIASDLLWLGLGVALLTFPLLLYMLYALGRGVLAVQQERPLHLATLLRVPVGRLAGMGCYSIIFSIIVNLVSSGLLYACFCPLIFGVAVFFGGAASTTADMGIAGTAVSALLGFLIVLLIVFFYVLSLIVSAATWSSMIYGLQPFIQHAMPFGQSISHSINLLFYRFGFNLLAFILTSLVFGTTALAVTTTIGTLVPLPLLLSLGEESPVAQGISLFAWLVGLMVVLPPMPIWMALLYQRNHAARAGTDLEARIMQLDAVDEAQEVDEAQQPDRPQA